MSTPGVQCGACVKTVLVLEDDSSSRSLLETVLERECRVIATDSPDNAIRFCESQAPDLLVSDNLLRAPISGLETLRRVHEAHPHLPLLIISGTPPEGWPDRDFECFEKLVQTARVGFLQKPFTSREFRQTSEELMSGDSGSQEIRTIYANAVKHRASAQSWRFQFSSQHAPESPND